MIKRSVVLILCLALLIPCRINVSAYNTDSISARSAVMLEAQNHCVIFEKNSRERLPMASTTKIMTALIVLECCSLKDTFTVDERAIGTEGTSAYLQKGDELTFEAALYALLLQSANDVAVALAYEVSDSIEGFAELMNRKAKELSLDDTHFKNPSGLPGEDHYTTAYDLALLTCFCLENNDFYRIVSTKTKTVKISGNERTFVNHNKLLSLYDGAIGVKTGFTKESGRCLVGACERDGVRLVTVTLSASNDWQDHMSMFNCGFEQYSSYTLYSEGDFLISIPVAGSKGSIIATPDGTKSVCMKKGTRITTRTETASLITTPVTKGDILGYAVFYSDKKELHRAPLRAISSSP
ncbi:MAG: D-alanyl-D-alanine carboxypeptidase [Clostridia bacterium]|nr:D-alanyl-D-alanine carboxypeptidase [Clostridia bacterium]